MGTATLVATGLRYPHPGHLEMLEQAVADMAAGKARSEMDRFVAAVRKMSLAEWEELHTVTLDLSPHVAPYVGHVVWGGDYRRGAFMAELVREQMEHEVDLAGELPDHLDPILRYLDATDEPLRELVDELPGAVSQMMKDLRKADKHSPYRHLLEAVLAVAEEAAETTRSVAT
jgi:nitrate reductase assembly molybdenum cofactor insertion protein NarJ